MKKCFLDLDGVLIDFLAAALQFHGVSYSYDEYPYELGNYKNCPPPHGNLTRGEFWDAFDANFWAHLPWMHDGYQILAAVEGHFGKENVCILTSPTRNSECVAGKVEWIRRELPDYRKKFLVGPTKAFCASSDSVLIDDVDRNVEAFKTAGGDTILVPRPWNSMHQEKTLLHVLVELSYIT